MGKTGDSCALYIAKRLGMPEDMIRTAASEAYGDGGELEKPLEKTRRKHCIRPEKNRRKGLRKNRWKNHREDNGREGWSGFRFPALCP